MTERKVRFYQRVEAEYQQLLSKGIGKGIAREALMERYGISQGTFYNAVDSRKASAEWGKAFEYNG